MPDKDKKASEACSQNEEKRREAALRNDLEIVRDLLARRTNHNSRNKDRDCLQKLTHPPILQMYMFKHA